MAESTKVSMLVFGGTGDLMKRKLVPACLQLAKQRVWGEGSRLIGVGRRALNDSEYRAFLGLSGKEGIDVMYVQVDFSKGDTMEKIRALMEEEKSEMRLYYLATAFSFFPQIVRALQKSELHEAPQGGWARIVFEKPFGFDLQSSNALDEEIHEVFREEQVFRIDHYLAKETVQNILALKATNPLIEGILHAGVVEKIELTVDEELGVGNRLGYYHSAGALKDMIQSHVLQVVTLLLLDMPSAFDARSLHDAKVSVLQAIRVREAHEHLFGQYASYAKEVRVAGLDAGKKTETFARIVVECANARWKGVPIVLRTGKLMGRKFGQLKVRFRDPPSNIQQTFQGTQANELLIELYPRQDIVLRMNMRLPAGENAVKSVSFTFSPENAFGPNTNDEYAALLADVIAGDQTLFTRFDEIAEAWRIVEEVESMRSQIPFVTYSDGTEPEGDIVKKMNDAFTSP